MWVSRKDLERSLGRLREVVRDPRAGIHGPGSTSWELNRETLNFLGAGRAALLQLAHPYVAHGVDQHSATRTDARGRFQRTFENVFAMTFGDLEQAMRAARRVHAVHSRIAGVIDEDVGRFSRGTPYRANDSGALFWVNATLVDSVFAVRAAIGRPVSSGEREAYYLESKRFARLFGIADEDIPEDCAGFDAYMSRMISSDIIAVGRPAREIAQFLFEPPSPALAPVMELYKAITAALLPAPLRGPFGLRFGVAERVSAAVSLRIFGALYALAPRPLRDLPGYVEAMERVEGRAGGPMERLARRASARLMGFWPRPA